MLMVAFGGFCLAAMIVRRRLLGPLEGPPVTDDEPPDPSIAHQRREDMIFIWTEIHGVPRERAESMYEEYERASAVASMGLKSK